MEHKRDRLDERVVHTRDKPGELVDHTRDRLAEWVEHTRDRLVEWVEPTRDRLAEWVERTRDMLGKLVDCIVCGNVRCMWDVVCRVADPDPDSVGPEPFLPDPEIFHRIRIVFWPCKVV